MKKSRKAGAFKFSPHMRLLSLLRCLLSLVLLYYYYYYDYYYQTVQPLGPDPSTPGTGPPLWSRSLDGSSPQPRSAMALMRGILKIPQEWRKTRRGQNGVNIGKYRHRDITPIMENHMEKKMDNEMETGNI